MNATRTRSSGTRSRLARSAALLALAAVLGAAECSSSPTSRVVIDADCDPVRGLSALVHGAEAAVIGTVREVDTSRFGLKSRHAFVREYRTAIVDVEVALWSSETLPVKAGKPVTFQMLGNGRHVGEVYPCSNVPDVRWNDVDGHVVEGSRVLLLLAVGARSEGMRKVRADGLGNSIRWGQEGSWTVVGDRAVSAVPGRSAPLEALVARLKEAHDAPLDPTSRRGAVDPLEPTEPPFVPLW